VSLLVLDPGGVDVLGRGVVVVRLVLRGLFRVERGAVVVVEASALRVGGLVVVQVRVPLVERLIGASVKGAKVYIPR
jgi:hypothetical protein